MTERSRLLSRGALTGLALVGAAEGAQAASANPVAVLARACAGRADAEISHARLGAARLIELKIIPSEFVADAMSGTPNPDLTMAEAYAGALVARLGEIEAGPGGHQADPRNDIHGSIRRLRSDLVLASRRDEIPLSIDGRAFLGSDRVFATSSPRPALKCAPADPEPTQTGEMEDYSAGAEFAIREKPEELAMVGKERRGAGSFGLALERTRTRQEDGSTKTATDFSINGTAGVRLSSAKSARTTSYLYGRYELQQARTKPAPTLAPGASQSDDDTDVLETGFTLSTDLMSNESKFKLFVDAQAAAVFDFANDAQRLKLRALIRPALDVSLGLCGLGSYELLSSSLGLMGRCRFNFDVEAAKILKRGSSPIGDFDSFLAAGGKAEFEALLPTGEAMDVVGSVAYRFLPVLHGGPDEIERFEASLKYRFWTRSQLGLDLGFTYTKGTNELSFEHEDVLTFGLGVIF